VVEVYFGYVRRKIDIPFGTTSIETIRGVGYRLESGEHANRNWHINPGPVTRRVLDRHAAGTRDHNMTA
jgi:hypothetical protein